MLTLCEHVDKIIKLKDNVRNKKKKKNLKTLSHLEIVGFGCKVIIQNTYIKKSAVCRSRTHNLQSQRREV